MTTIPVDMSRIDLIGTGNVTPTMEWAQGADGKNRPSDVQAVNEQNVPLWSVEVLRQDRVFGTEKTVSTQITVPHHTEPQIKAFSPIAMHGVEVNVYSTKNGGMRESWRAEGIDGGNKPVQSEPKTN